MTRRTARVRFFRQIEKVLASHLEQRSFSQELEKHQLLVTFYLAQLSYFDRKLVASRLVWLGASRMSFYDHDHASCFFADIDGYSIVSFRGSDMETNDYLKRAFTFWKMPFAGLKVHKGFCKCLQSFLPDVLRDIDSASEANKRVYVGHSLGGALSVLLSLKRKPDMLCTFGAPKVAGREIESRLIGIDYKRVVTKWDWICLLPPHFPLVMPYRATGTRYVLDAKWSWRHIIEPHVFPSYMKALLEDQETS